jgi:outer membrane protein assembly factor BamB
LCSACTIFAALNMEINMKLVNYLFVACLLLTSTSLNAQKKFVTKVYELGDTIGSIATDSTKTGRHFLRAFTIQKTRSGKRYKSSGEMILFDLDTSKELWRRPFIYLSQSSSSCDLGILQEGNLKMSLLNFDDGKPIWSKASGGVMHYDVKDNLLLWRTASILKDQTTVEAHDVTTGEKKWQTNLGWVRGDQYYLNDSILFLQDINTLYLLNMHNGKTHQYHISTSSLYRAGKKSNVIFNDSCFYMAEKDRIFCLNDTLGNVWSADLPKDAVSTSSIYANKDQIILCNLGIGVNQFSMKRDWDHTSVGYPFIAGFNKKDGTQIFFKKIANKKTQVRDFYTKDDVEYIMFDDSIVCCARNDSAVVRSLPWDAKKYGKLSYLLRGDVYFANSDSTIFLNAESDYYRQFIVTDNNNIYEVDKDLNVMASHVNGQFSGRKDECNGHIILKPASKDNLIIVNQLGVREGEIKDVLSPTLKRLGNRFFVLSTDRSKIIEFKL